MTTKKINNQTYLVIDNPCTADDVLKNALASETNVELTGFPYNITDIMYAFLEEGFHIEISYNKKPIIHFIKFPPMMKHYKVFIKKEYIRDAQAFSGSPKACDNIQDVNYEEYWRDVNGDTLVYDRYAKNINEVKSALKRLYGDNCDIDTIFRIDVAAV